MTTQRKLRVPFIGDPSNEEFVDPMDLFPNHASYARHLIGLIESGEFEVPDRTEAQRQRMREKFGHPTKEDTVLP